MASSLETELTLTSQTKFCPKCEHSLAIYHHQLAIKRNNPDGFMGAKLYWCYFCEILWFFAQCMIMPMDDNDF